MGHRIAYLVPEFPSQTHAFFWRELSAMRQLGAEIYLLSTKRPQASSTEHGFAAEARRQTHYLFPPGVNTSFQGLRRHLGLGLAASQYCWQLHESAPQAKLKLLALCACAPDLVHFLEQHRIDHLHVHSCANSAHLAALAQRVTGVPYSLTLHGDLPVYGTDHRQKMEAAAFVSTVTQPLKESVVSDVGLTEERVPVIWMGVDTERFTPPEQELDTDRLQLVTVARLNRFKGHLHALNAIAEARDKGVKIAYQIAGAGPFENEIRAHIHTLKLEESVKLLGTMPEDQVLELLRNCDAFVLPSFGLGEAAPVSVMEAMACGRAVVCSKIGGTPSMLTHEHDGLLIEQQDETGLETAFTRLGQEPEFRRALGIEARKTALARFDYRTQAERLLTCITDGPAALNQSQ